MTHPPASPPCPSWSLHKSDQAARRHLVSIPSPWSGTTPEMWVVPRHIRMMMMQASLAASQVTNLGYYLHDGLACCSKSGMGFWYVKIVFWKCSHVNRFLQGLLFLQECCVYKLLSDLWGLICGVLEEIFISATHAIQHRGILFLA